MASENYTYSKVPENDLKHNNRITTNVFYLDICLLDGYSEQNLISYNIICLIIQYWGGLLSKHKQITLNLSWILHNEFCESLLNQTLLLDQYIKFHFSHSDTFKETQKVLSHYKQKFIKHNIKVDQVNPTVTFTNKNTKLFASEMSYEQQLFYFCRTAQTEKIKDVWIKSDYSIDINMRDNENEHSIYNTALHYAVQSGSLETVKIIYNLEALLDVPNKLGSTPLHVAVSMGFTDIVEFLISVAADLEARNLIQNTPLHCAVYAGHVNVVTVLLDHAYGDPREALMECNGIGFMVIDYAAHEHMKDYLRQFFPTKISNIEGEEEEKYDQY